MRFVVAVLTASVLLAGNRIATLRLEAPFDELFSASQADPDYVVEGKLTEAGGEALPVKISVRGHTSRRESECTFPKLKVERRGGQTLKIGTHCGETIGRSLTPRYGRLPNERSPWREAAVYHILAALGVPVLEAQPARITYVFDGGRTLERNALLLEDDDDAARRLGGHKIDAQAFTSADRLFPVEDAATIAFAEALVGNFDWFVKFSATDTYRLDAKLKLWNVIAVATQNGKARPLLHDFDVSGMVTGSHRWFRDVFNPAFEPTASPRVLEVIGQLQRARALFARAELDATRQRFIARKADAYRALDESEIDTDGRVVIKEYLDAFFREIESDQRFYRPVVTAAGTIARIDAGPSAPPACGNRSEIPVGTPVSAPLESRGEDVRVAVLDSLWHWAPPQRCPAVKTGTVWIAASAISSEFPER